MKKTILIAVLLLSVATLIQARQIGKRYAKLPLLDSELDRAVSAQQVKKNLSWQAQLAQIQTQVKQMNLRPGTELGLPAMVHDALSHEEEQAYLHRLVQVQKSVGNNPALAGYTFVAPVPADLARMSLDNYAALHAFLKELKIAKVAQTERVRPFTLAVQIQGVPRGALELWLDVPTKKVYLMSDNFYTTAKGKYGLHLK